MTTEAPRGRRLGMLAPAPVAAAPVEHVHGPGCSHGHDDHGHDHHGHDHHGHDHHGHDHHEHEAKPHPPDTRPAETGGVACQLDLSVIIPGETDDKGRFEKLEHALEAHPGVLDVHLRRDAGHAEVCVHYDVTKLSVDRVLTLVRSSGAEVSQRYLMKTWFVRGMDSPQCAYTIEYALSRAKGVLQANVAYAAERLVLEYDKQVLSLSDVQARVHALGYELEEPSHGHGCCGHHGADGHGPSLEIPLALASGALLGVGFAVEKLGVGTLPTLLYGLAAISGGFYATRGAANSVVQKRVDIETLMVLAAVGAAVLGAWFEGALLLFLFSLGHALEHRAMARARRALEALGKLRPKTALLVRGTEVVSVAIEQVQRGDRVVVRPGDRVPLDGVIREGRSSLDQSAITGESIPVAKSPGDRVFAGTINAEGSLHVEVTKLAADSSIAKVIEMVAAAEARKSTTQRFAQRLEQKFVPVVLFAAPVLAIAIVAQRMMSPDHPSVFVALQEGLLRACSLLVAASPCALAISTPAATLSAVARAARGGVLVKGGAHLEALGNVSVLAFDKTGTLTVGKPKVLSIDTAAGSSEAELLGTAAGAEALTSHPIAKAVTDAAREKNVPVATASGCELIHGKGLRATLDGARVSIGSLALFEGTQVPEAVRASVARLEEAGQTTVVVQRGERFLGVLGVADPLRGEAKAALGQLHAIGIKKTMMLSGDNLRVAKAIGAQVGIDEPRAPLLPEGKVAVLKELAKEGGVAMVGDGVNDAPALAAASVGIAMGGAGSDVALETADVVLMSDDLARLPFAIGLARQATAIVRQNLIVALGVSAVLVLSSIFGWVRIGEAVVLHEGSTLLVVANGLRLLAYRG